MCRGCVGEVSGKRPFALSAEGKTSATSCWLPLKFAEDKREQRKLYANLDSCYFKFVKKAALPGEHSVESFGPCGQVPKTKKQTKPTPKKNIHTHTLKYKPAFRGLSPVRGFSQDSLKYGFIAFLLCVFAFGAYSVDWSSFPAVRNCLYSHFCCAQTTSRVKTRWKVPDFGFLVFQKTCTLRCTDPRSAHL